MEKSSKKIDIDDPIPTNDPKHYYVALGILIGLILALGVILASSMIRTTTKFQNPKFRLISSTSHTPSVIITRNFMDGMILHNPDTWNLSFMIKNPNNNYILYYDNLEAKITYNDNVYWQANVSSNFHQVENTQTLIDAVFGALNDNNIDYIVDYVVRDVHVGHPTIFSVSLNGKVQMTHREAHNRLDYGKLQISCEGLEVEFLSNENIGTLEITSNACDVLLRPSVC
ncbi:hypothetical protein P3S67_021733 [Capsicum chacoense]